MRNAVLARGFLIVFVGVAACGADSEEAFSSSEEALDGTTDTAVPVAPVAPPSADVMTALPEPKTIRCNRLLLNTTKSYVVTGQGGHYAFTMGIVRCAPYGVEPLGADEQVDFEVKYVERSTDEGSGYRFFDASGLGGLPWSQQGTFRIRLTGGRFPVDLATFPQSRHLALAYRARPTNRPEIGWSDWVRVNYNTRLGLMDAKSYWPYSNVNAYAHYEGINYMNGDRPFRAVYATWTRDWPDRYVPTTRADVLNVYLKDNAYGYHGPRSAFDFDANNIWTTGETDCLFWVSVETQPGHRREERILVSNAFTMLQWRGGVNPTFADGRRWWDGNVVADDRNWIRGVTGGDGTTGCRPFVAGCAKKPKSGAIDPLTDNNYNWMANKSPDGLSRNYTLLPEYVADGWGLWVTHARDNANPRNYNALWVAQASVLPRRSMPGVAVPPGGSANDAILHVAYYETSTSAFDRHATASGPGHREDWYLDRLGARIVRIEGRSVSAQRASPFCAGARCTRYAPSGDPDFISRAVMSSPHYCSTRTDAGSCAQR